ncbi:MAG: DUF7793 family protein [Bacteroidia bacterium]
MTELSHSIITYRKPVVFVRFKENAELDVAEVRELIKAVEKLTGNHRYLLLSDATGHVNITSEGRKISADKNEAPLMIANAAVVNNLAVKLTANFFASFNKPAFPFEVFNREEKALKWLLQFDPDRKPDSRRPPKKSLNLF